MSSSNGFAGSSCFPVNVSQGPGFSGSELRTQVQVLEIADCQFIQNSKTISIKIFCSILFNLLLFVLTIKKGAKEKQTMTCCVVRECFVNTQLLSTPRYMNNIFKKRLEIKSCKGREDS